MKHLWHLLIDKKSLWVRVLHTKYFKDKTILLTPSKTISSRFWKGIRKHVKECFEGIKWQISKGDVYFWRDKWISSKPIIDLVP